MRDTTTDAPPAYPTRYDDNLVAAASSLGSLLTNAGIPTRVVLPRSPLPIAPAAERALTEIAIEAVTNILKHAPKTQSATIEVLTRTGAVELVVGNVSSAGAPPRALTTGRGLQRARQRISQSEGVLVAGVTDDGWVFRATVPTVVGRAR
jgi:signal transduction histidine kinase